MQILKKFFIIAGWFWTGKRSLGAWTMLAVTLGASLAIVKVATLMNAWDKKFYDAIEKFEKDLMLPLVGEFLVYTAIIVLFIVIGNWFKKLLVISWRENLSQKMENLWLKNANFYRLSGAAGFDNPDQRIAEDSLLLADKSVNLIKSMVYNLSKLFAFTFILWEASKVLRFSAFGREFALEGFLVYVALVYTLFSSLITHLIGRTLKRLNYEKQQVEADYRANLLITRENAEAIALMKGACAEKSRFRASFGEVVRNWRVIMNTEFRLECFSASYLKVTNLIPIFACLPLYFAHAMSFGDMMRARSAFYSVQDGFAWFMDYYKQIMEWAASVERVYKFIDIAQATDSKVKFDAKIREQNSDLDGVNEPAQVTAANLAQDKFDENAEANELRCTNLQIFTPSGEKLVCGLNLSVKSGEWVLLRGASGTGKSSVFRYIVGIWDHGSGEVCVPRGTMSVPQKPFLARMSLRRLIAYPSDLQGVDTDFEGILRRVRLEKFIRELDEVKDWGKILSGGEAQRLAFARVYFAQPTFLLLDEATSALDSALTKELLTALKRDFPRLGVLAITHQEELKFIFDKVVDTDKI
ncbi:ABC transporter ATP-binding protein/permease [uncultured Campylobacter sp.]|uniref:ABC transporter ATP-binding protein/permease n=1 Tax=uncultured Campylobacter sp. TaxID=218934 RepID=UPI0028E4C6DA|nr:ABC transporter ATP-binding protein/permease [uncultured Campylobacter sp.]